MGAHIDGFIAVAALTVVVSSLKSTEKITGRKADVILAAHWAVQAALRLLKSGNSVSVLTFNFVNIYCSELEKIRLIQDSLIYICRIMP